MSDTDALGARLDAVQTRLEGRIDAVGDRLADQFAKAAAANNQLIANLSQRVTEVATRQQENIPTFRRLQDEVADLRARPDNTPQVVDHEHRIGSLEDVVVRPQPAVAALELRVRTIEDTAHEQAGARKVRTRGAELAFACAIALVSGGGVALISWLAR